MSNFTTIFDTPTTSIATKKQENNEKYILDFLKELLTIKGSSYFDKNYGTTFVIDLGANINPYKVEYYLKKAINKIIENHNEIKRVEIENIGFSKTKQELTIKMKFTTQNVVFAMPVFIPFSGNFTTETILE